MESAATEGCLLSAGGVDAGDSVRTPLLADDAVGVERGSSEMDDEDRSDARVLSRTRPDWRYAR